MLPSSTLLDQDGKITNLALPKWYSQFSKLVQPKRSISRLVDFQSQKMTAAESDGRQKH